jgi:hypothetical protein
MSNDSDKSSNPQSGAAGGNLLKILVALLVLAVVGWAVWAFVINPGNVATNEKKAKEKIKSKEQPVLPYEIPPFGNLPGVNYELLGENGEVFEDAFVKITSDLEDLTDATDENEKLEYAESIVAAADDLKGKVDGMKLEELSGEAKESSKKQISTFLEAVEKLRSFVKNEKAKEKIKPALDSLVEKLTPLKS